MKEFNGSKFRCIGTHIEYDIWWNAVEKQDFVLTKGYKEWLQQRELEKQNHEIRVLKDSIKYQIEHYGEADKFDVMRLKWLISKL